ncbi:MAG: hypothetical protein E7452_00310 [Ruminococcaceae bacterium]|nr:hypothetical protein [Oscillospiraceae bacterium]
MDSRKFVLVETGIIAIGEVLCIAAMMAIYLLIGYYDTSVLLGGIIGGVLAVGNFLFMAIGASLAADKALAQNVKGGKAVIRNSMLLRYLVIFVILAACAKSGLCDAIALVIPLIFVRPIMMISEFFRKKGD